jgi:hypothetical protein
VCIFSQRGEERSIKRSLARFARFGAAVAAVAVAAACSGRATTDVAAPPDPRTVILDLGDLPDGYLVGDDGGCGRLGVEDASPAVVDIVTRSGPVVCSFEYERAWAGEPRLIETAAVVFARPEDAKTAYRERAAVLEYVFLAPGDPVGPRRPVGLGAGGELQRFRERIFGEPPRPLTRTTWRYGNVIAAVSTSHSRTFALAMRLARRQQQLLVHPRSLAALDLDDAEVELDDPAIELPVYWVGRRFAPRGLPPLELYKGTAISGDGPGYDVELEYDRLAIDMWRPRAFRRFLRTRLGRMVRTSSCARRTELKLANGRATVYAGFAARVHAPCPERPDHVMAHVFFPGVVATVNLPYCYSCVGPSGREGPYNSVRAITAVVRGLRVRSRPR